MKQKIMDIQKSLFIGWFPKMAHNDFWLCDGGFYAQSFFKTAIAKPVLCVVAVI